MTLLIEIMGTSFSLSHNFQGRRFLDHLPGLISEEMAEKRSLYECFHAKVKGEGIYCAKGHRFKSRWKERKRLSIDQLVRGAPLVFGICQGCIDYEPMGGPIPAEERGWIRHKSNISLDRTLVIADNGIVVDSVSHGDFWAITACNLRALFGLSELRDDFGTPPHRLRAPGHDYWWQYPEVYSQIMNFLNKHFGGPLL